jgi:hypothetical protein
MIYEAQCKKCKKVHEFMATVAERNNTPMCCGKQTERVILTPPEVGAMNWGREKSVTMPDGTFIETGSEYKKYLKDHNKVPVSEGIPHAERVRKRKKKELKEKLHKTVIESYEKLKAGKAA